MIPDHFYLKLIRDIDPAFDVMPEWKWQLARMGARALSAVWDNPTLRRKKIPFPDALCLVYYPKFGPPDLVYRVVSDEFGRTELDKSKVISTDLTYRVAGDSTTEYRAGMPKPTINLPAPFIPRQLDQRDVLWMRYRAWYGKQAHMRAVELADAAGAREAARTSEIGNKFSVDAAFDIHGFKRPDIRKAMAKPERQHFAL